MIMRAAKLEMEQLPNVIGFKKSRDKHRCNDWIMITDVI